MHNYKQNFTVIFCFSLGMCASASQSLKHGSSKMNAKKNAGKQEHQMCGDKSSDSNNANDTGLAAAAQRSDSKGTTPK